MCSPCRSSASAASGRGAAGLEIVKENPEVTVVFVPVSGGGLMWGVATAGRARGRTARVVGADPAGAPRFARSRAAGKPVLLKQAETIADGLRVLTPGKLTWEIANQYVDEFMAVSDEETLGAVRRLLADGKVVVEPSGAVAVAAAFGMGASDIHLVGVVRGGEPGPPPVFPPPTSGLTPRPRPLQGFQTPPT